MNNKKLATACTYDTANLTSTGYDVTLYADGSISLEGHSNWQGSISGDRYRSNAGLVDVSDIDPADPDNDAEAALCAWLATFDRYDLPSEYNANSEFRQTRRGSRVC